MLLQIFKSLLITSAVGGILTMLLLVFKPVTKRCFSAAWQYYAWLIVLVVMMLPITIKLPQAAPAFDLPASQTVQQLEAETVTRQEIMETQVTPIQAKNITISRAKNFMLEITDIVCYIWLIGVLSILVLNYIKYSVFLRAIRKNSVIMSYYDIGTKKIITRKTSMIDAPLMIGLLRPTLLLPNLEMTQENLNYILLHEMTHYKRHDLWYKWFAVLVNAVHWFNPFVYIVSKQIDEECEISCDLSVVADLNEQEQTDYMNTILNLITHSACRNHFLTTAMASSLTQIKRRFTMIRKYKKSNKFVSALSVMTAAVILVATIFASGVFANAVTENDKQQIEVTKSGQCIDYANKPFIENGILYLPLRETLEPFVNFSEGISEIIWDDSGEIILNLFDQDSKRIREDGGVYYAYLYHYKLKIGVSAVYTGEKIDFLLSSPPVVKKDTTYVPVEVIEYIKTESGLLDGFSVRY